MPQELRLGTRGSPLALWQAHAVAASIRETGGPACRIVVIKTSGDELQHQPLSQVGGKRLFVKEIEDALARGDIDLAVHSSKDMPAVLPVGLTIGAVLPREDPLDAVVLPRPVQPAPEATGEAVGSSAPLTAASINDIMAALGESPAIGTASVRRTAQLRRLLPHARFAPIRGNLDTRLRKLDRGDHDALVLAAAGLRRLGFESRIAARLPWSACVPAPGQGIVAVEVRGDDGVVAAIVRLISDAATAAALDAERALVEALGGGCQTPIGALALPAGSDRIELHAVVVSLDGRRALHATSQGGRHEAAAIGARVGADLLAEGAGDILAEARRMQGAVEGLQR